MLHIEPSHSSPSLPYFTPLFHSPFLSFAAAKLLRFPQIGNT